jgi:single-stranded-DNA-specific exonuclease
MRYVQRNTNFERVGDSLLAALTRARGEAPEQSAPGLTQLAHWQSLHGIHGAAERIGKAIRARETIAVVGDYDADGATASAVLLRGFAALSAVAVSVIPSRITNGYGLTPAVVDYVASTGAKLIVTVDNGINALAGVAAAYAQGIEVVVTDHHLAGEVLPECAAIVNPNQPACGFESKALAGCGVAFYVLLALRALLRAENYAPAVDFDVRDLLPYVAIGTVADMVRLDSNNRALVNAGVRRIQAGQCALGITGLIRAAGRAPESLSTADIAFAVAPRINAAGRIADMSVGIECLTTFDRVAAEHLATQLHITNEARKAVQAEGMEAIEPMVADIPLAQAVVVKSTLTHEGVVGILAGRIKELRHVPAVVFCDRGDGTLKGSARSVPGFHIRDAIADIERGNIGLIRAFGGHAGAAGLTLDEANFEVFAEAFAQAFADAAAVDPELLEQRVLHDGALPERYLSVEHAFEIERTPWGQGYLEPIFINTFSVGRFTVLKELHAQIDLVAASGLVVRAIWFRKKRDFAVGETVTLAYRLQVNRWKLSETLQLMVIDEPGAAELPRKAA